MPSSAAAMEASSATVTLLSLGHCGIVERRSIDAVAGGHGFGGRGCRRPHNSKSATKVGVIIGKGGNIIRIKTPVESVKAKVKLQLSQTGKKLSESIITEKLAACVNRVPGIESGYWWNGKVQTDSEELLNQDQGSHSWMPRQSMSNIIMNMMSVKSFRCP